MKKFIGTVLVLCCLALPLAGCEDAKNIKFEISDSRYRDKVFYTSMSNVELVYRDNNVDYGTDYAVYPGNTSKFDRKGK